jgi:hypothetical protein
MDKPISVGDLVTYRKVCCPRFTDGVWIFRVAVMHRQRPADCKCMGCGAPIPYEVCAAELSEYPGTPLSWLKRIPPLSELEGERTQEDIREPA